MVLNRSCPAVSHLNYRVSLASVLNQVDWQRTICNLIRFPSNSIVRILKSMPIVVIKEGVQASSQNRNSRQDLPTPIRASELKVVVRSRPFQRTRVADEEKLRDAI